MSKAFTTTMSMGREQEAWLVRQATIRDTSKSFLIRAALFHIQRQIEADIEPDCWPPIVDPPQRTRVPRPPQHRVKGKFA